MEDSRITKINEIDASRGNPNPGMGREIWKGTGDSPGSIPALAITHFVTTGLRLLVERRTLLAHESEVQHLPRGEAGRAIVEQSAIPGVAVKTIHLLLQTIEARVLPRSRELSLARSMDRGFRRRFWIFSCRLDDRRGRNRRNRRRMFGENRRNFCNILLIDFGGSCRDFRFFRIFIGARLAE